MPVNRCLDNVRSENQQLIRMESEDTREAWRIRTCKDDEDRSCQTQSCHTVSLLAFVGFGVIGLSVGVWLGLFVEGAGDGDYRYI